MLILSQISSYNEDNRQAKNDPSDCVLVYHEILCFSKIFEVSPAACGRGRRAEVRGQLCLGLESSRFSSRDLHGGQNISQKLTRAQQKTCVLRTEQGWAGQASADWST